MLVRFTLSFEWGTTTNYGSSIQRGSNHSYNCLPASFTSSLSGLTAGTTYHYRAVANAGAVTVDGAESAIYHYRQYTCARDIGGEYQQCFNCVNHCCFFERDVNRSGHKQSRNRLV